MDEGYDEISMLVTENFKFPETKATNMETRLQGQRAEVGLAGPENCPVSLLHAILV